MITVRCVAENMRAMHKVLLDMIAMPPRKPRGDIRNIRRSMVVAIANHQMRVTLMSPAAQKTHRAGCDRCKVRVFKKGIKLQ